MAGENPPPKFHVFPLLEYIPYAQRFNCVPFIPWWLEPSCSVLTFCRHQIENRKRLTALNWLSNDLRGMASQHINAWSKIEQISLRLRDGRSPWYSPQPTSTRCRTKVWKKKKMNWSFDSCWKMFVCNFCETVLVFLAKTIWKAFLKCEFYRNT